MKKDEISKSIIEGAEVVDRLKHEQEIANQAWAHFLALHRSYTSKDERWKTALDELSQFPRLAQIADALIRDTLSACFRLLDMDDRSFTLLRVQKLLSIQAVRGHRLAFFEQCKFTTRDQAVAKIDCFMSFFPAKWPVGNDKQKHWPNKSEVPTDWTLADLRAELIHVRHKLIAHAGTFSKHIPIKKLDNLVKLTDQLVCSAEWIFKGSSGGSTLPHRQIEAADFWSCVENGFINAARPS